MLQIKHKIFVAKFEDLPKRIGREVVVDTQKIAVFRLQNDSVKAIGGICPHTNGPLAEGIVSGDYVYCPLREVKVSLIDGKVQEPDEGSVPTYETLIEDGNVYILI